MFKKKKRWKIEGRTSDAVVVAAGERREAGRIPSNRLTAVLQWCVTLDPIHQLQSLVCNLLVVCRGFFILLDLLHNWILQRLEASACVAVYHQQKISPDRPAVPVPWSGVPCPT